MGDRLQARLSTAFMDVRRQVGAVQGVEVLKGVPVHMGRRSIDNPNPQAVSHVPVLMSVTLHMPVETDVQNGDVIIVRTVNERGETIDAYRGAAGSPFTVNSRKRIAMTMQALGRDEMGDGVV